MFANDKQFAIRHEGVNIGYASCDCIVHGNHGEVGFIILNGLEGFVEGVAWDCFEIGENSAASEVGIGAICALEGYSFGILTHFYIDFAVLKVIFHLNEYKHQYIDCRQMLIG